MGLIAGVLAGGCHRLADDIVDYDALRIDACERVCNTIDACDPDRFLGQEPEDCFGRCMTLMPKLHEENQCGSRQILEFRCVGALTCNEFSAYEDAHPIEVGDADGSIACVREAEATLSCSPHEPFDLHGDDS
jgi:hypothetical protein